MSLAAQRPLHSGEDVAECRGVGGVLESMQEGGTLASRQVELPRTAISDVDGDDAGNLLTERLNGDWSV